MLKLGIIGVGNMGSGHATRIKEGACPNIVVTAVADRRASRRAWAQENVPGAQVFAEGSELIQAGVCDAVLIATPHYQHPTLAAEAFEAGLHVLCEKPAGVYTLQVRDMMAAADKHPDRVFAMMFNQRTNCVYRKMRELVQSGKYGQIRRTNWLITNWYRCQAYYDSGDWRATWSGEGGGVLMNQCPHQLDLWQWICGMPVSINAHMKYGKWHDIEVEDDVTVYAEYENGATGVFITTTGDAFGSNRFEIQMDKAKLVAEDDKLRVWEFAVSEQEFSRTNTVPFGCPDRTEIDPELDGENLQHIAVIRAWGGAILRGEPLVAAGEEGINGLTLANAMYLSDWLGKTVELPFDEDLYYEELMKRVATSRRKAAVETVVADVTNTFAGTK